MLTQLWQLNHQYKCYYQCVHEWVHCGTASGGFSRVEASPECTKARGLINSFPLNITRTTGGNILQRHQCSCKSHGLLYLHREFTNLQVPWALAQRTQMLMLWASISGCGWNSSGSAPDVTWAQWCLPEASGSSCPTGSSRPLTPETPRGANSIQHSCMHLGFSFYSQFVHIAQALPEGNRLWVASRGYPLWNVRPAC